MGSPELEAKGREEPAWAERVATLEAMVSVPLAWGLEQELELELELEERVESTYLPMASYLKK